MKVGIITFHDALNYGAILQGYALQEALVNLGADANIINYRNEYSVKEYASFDIKRIKSPKLLIKEVLRYPVRKKKHKNVQGFSDNFYRLSEKECFNNEDLKSLNNQYDSFITGSDQVWNYDMRGFDKAYFLDFVEDSKKKNSYAASFGVSEIPEDLKSTYEKLLSDFNHVSIREKQGQVLYKELVDKESSLNVDPSLLLNREQWLKIAKYPKINKKYILVYALINTPTLFKFISNLAKDTGCEVVFIGSYLKTKYSGAKYINAPSPDEFVGLFANAEYVVTNSFHGIAFSINMNRNFFAELQPPPAKRNSRLENLLDLVGLRDRLIKDGKHKNIKLEIDYSIVNEKLNEERSKSIKYLKEIISE